MVRADPDFEASHHFARQMKFPVEINARLVAGVQRLVLTLSCAIQYSFKEIGG